MLAKKTSFRVTLTMICLISFVNTVTAYPIDGYEHTKISRLEGYYFSLRTPSGKRNIVPGARLPTKKIKPRLLETRPPWPAVDPDFSRRLAAVLGPDRKNYGVVVLDLSDPNDLRLAEYNAHHGVIPGSVGKVLVAQAIFQLMADLYPADIAKRQKILRETIITADEFIIRDEHEVPFWSKDQGRIWFRPLEVGDTANLWTYLDWMLSASSNAAASVLMKQIILLKHFGTDYPVSAAREKLFFKQSSKTKLVRLIRDAMNETVTKNGMQPNNLTQKSFFTRKGRQLVPSRGSRATPRELAKLLFLMEKGELIDRFSSTELKRLLFMTQRRIRYAAAWKLNDSAVYFKSGSLYKCRSEKNYLCQKYEGNALNLMNSIAIVEHPIEPLTIDQPDDRSNGESSKNSTKETASKYHYIVALTSNVLKKNSAADHAAIASRIHELIKANNQTRDTKRKSQPNR